MSGEAAMKAYVYVCDEFAEIGLTFRDLTRRGLITGAVKNAVRECLDAEAEEVELARGVMAKDWAVLEYEAKTKFATLRPRVIFTNGDPAKALEEAEKMPHSGGP
ncbi:hypothetical protein Pogu_2158 [Pyrobaculum oguniense TE7]|uniref:Uncharacterized protein n=1 Tax=Pyrobaculum oguniense (strain DSM 13380 / JCM 10595 / TE7) TaxID=698757 RepID=H6QBA9_PYROT|nr:hypothetical protein Pogu_2158 [Pyrobaculum oguniense TE7]